MTKAPQPWEIVRVGAVLQLTLNRLTQTIGGDEVRG
jgi:hypothetical protein